MVWNMGDNDAGIHPIFDGPVAYELIDEGPHYAPHVPMTQEQRDLFMDAAETGWTCGLTHPYEWFLQATRCIAMDYRKIPEYVEKVTDAFHAFERANQGPVPVGEELTREQFIERVNRWFETGRKTG